MLFPGALAGGQSLDDQIRQKFFRQFVLRELPIDRTTPGLELMSAGGAAPKIDNFTFAAFSDHSAWSELFRSVCILAQAAVQLLTWGLSVFAVNTLQNNPSEPALMLVKLEAGVAGCTWR